MRIAAWLFLTGCAPATAIIGEVNLDGTAGDTGSAIDDTDVTGTPDGDSTDSDATSDTNTDPGGDTNTDPGGDTNTDPGGDTNTDPGGDTNTDPGGDTSTDPGGDTSTDPGGDTSDPGGDTSTDTGGSSGGDPTPTGPLRWDGKRAFQIPGDWGSEGCTEEVSEAGEDVSADPDWADAVATCTSCDAVFRLTVSPDTICGSIPIATEIFRGIEYRSSTSVRIYRIEQSYWGGWNREVIADGVYLGENIVYAYDGNYYGRRFHVEGATRVHTGP